jgi:uncharacterized RDD family membrane protein YckC
MIVDLVFDLGSIIAAFIAIIFAARLHRLHRQTRLATVYSLMAIAFVFLVIAELMEFVAYIAPGMVTEAFHAIFEVLMVILVMQGLHVMYVVWRRMEPPVRDRTLLIEYLSRFPDYMDILRNETRLQILLSLYENVEMSYTELLNVLGIDKGLLNFHLKKLKGIGFLKTDEAGTYTLSADGKAVLSALIYVVRDTLEQKRSLQIRLDWTIVLKRVGAFMVDVLILAIFTGLFFSRGFNEVISRFIALDLANINFTYEAIYPYIPVFYLSMLYFTLFEAYKGQTPGKYLFKIRIERIDGLKPSFMDVTIRNLGKVLFLPLDLLLGIILYRRKRFLRLFDYYTGICVVDVV